MEQPPLVGTRTGEPQPARGSFWDGDENGQGAAGLAQQCAHLGTSSGHGRELGGGPYSHLSPPPQAPGVSSISPICFQSRCRAAGPVGAAGTLLAVCMHPQPAVPDPPLVKSRPRCGVLISGLQDLLPGGPLPSPVSPCPPAVQRGWAGTWGTARRGRCRAELPADVSYGIREIVLGLSPRASTPQARAVSVGLVWGRTGAAERL